MRPEMSQMIAKSLGLRASNSSATRGRPPVMSRFLPPSRGMRARMSPACISWPFSTDRMASSESRERVSWPEAFRIGWPSAPWVPMRGRKSPPRGRPFQPTPPRVEIAVGGGGDVEGTHGEVRARLADRLGGDDAHRFADVDGRAPCQVAAVAGAADADLGFAGQHRTDADLFETGLVDLLDGDFIDQLAGLADHVAVQRIDNIFELRPTQHPLAERLPHLAPVHDTPHGAAPPAAAIRL